MGVRHGIAEHTQVAQNLSGFPDSDRRSICLTLSLSPFLRRLRKSTAMGAGKLFAVYGRVRRPDCRNRIFRRMPNAAGKLRRESILRIECEGERERERLLFMITFPSPLSLTLAARKSLRRKLSV